MSETIVGVLQGITTGAGILAAGVGLFLASSTSGNFQLVLNDQVVAWHSPASAMDSEPAAEVAVAPTAAPREVEMADEPTPAPTSTPSYTADSSYYNDTAADLSLLVVSLKRLDILLANPQPGDDGWRREVDTVTRAVRMGTENLTRVRPSEASIDVHSFLMSATARCTRVALALDGDLTRLPVETFQLVGDTLSGCTTDVVLVLQSIN